MAEENLENQQSTESEGENTENQQPQGLSQEDVDKQIQEALKKQKDETAQAQKEAEAKHKQEIEDARKKGEERAKMTAQQKADDDMKQRKAQMEQREADLKARMDKLDQRDALSSTRSSLEDKGIPNTFGEFLSDVDENKRSENIAKFEEIYQSAIQKAVDEKLKGTHNPQTSSNAPKSTGNMNQKDWDKMSYSEKAKLFNEDPDLADKLSSQSTRL